MPKRMPWWALALLVAGVLTPPMGWAQTSADEAAMLPLAERPTLLGGPNSPEQWLRDRGVGIDASWTGFGQALTSPSSGDNSMQGGGKLNAKFNFDFSKLGLWQGFSASALYEQKWGHGANGFNGVLLPVNTQMYEPKDRDSAVSLTFTQRFSDTVSLTAGKFNMVDAASATPIVGGGGINTFWNLNFAAPPSGIVPAYITGFSLSVKTEPANYTLMVYDPKDSQNDSGLSGWGKNGINTRLAVQFPVKIGGLDGYQTIVGAFSTQDTVDLADLPQIVLPIPRGPSTRVDVKGNSWYLGYNFQQYLWQNPATPTEGWGIFGQAFIADGNPNVYRWFTNLGVAGSSPIPGRSRDRFGIGYFRTSFSHDLTNSLKIITGATIDDESGVEVFYNAALTPWLRLGLDLQYIRPGVRGQGNATFAGMSMQVKF
ncbi:carbohydrate porin [Variovorax sp. YR216]|uniref:carbohydrate porin n=1 Tax=Variovorax sp. YR216 TaxID=1882828 RepID=UPI0015A47C31|nr:carbohydrate porin [Variovorax sp. YR216]